MSTHHVHPPGVAALQRWGLRERLAGTGCPPVERYSFDFGPVKISGSPRPIDGVAVGFCPRRTILDHLLVEAAVEAGAELRDEFTVDQITTADGAVTGIRGHARGGSTITERARVVIGADGKHSLVAKTVRPEQYLQRPSRLAMYYAYWSGLDVDGFETTIRAERRRGWAAIPTHDQLTVIGVGWPLDEFKANRSDVERSFQASIGLVPEFAERVRDARRESKFIGTADLPGYLRKPYGDGWALIGDAGYHKNPITAMGINDAFRDAELVAAALDDAFSGRARFDQAMGRYQSARDAAALPVYELTDEFAMLEPPPAELQQLLGAIVGDQDAMDDFVSVQANTLAAPEFFAPENVGRLMSRTAPVTARA
jgi:2-polyprenyl-6-methoxyphenol hydroxylase-like FAD-dependent oxidoreductase